MYFFFFNDTATTEIYTLSLHVALPISELGRLAFRLTFVLLYACWNAGTLLGAVGAKALGNPATFGLDVAAPAAFLALLAPRLRNGRTERQVAAARALGGAAATPFPPAGAARLCAARAGAVGLRRL